MRIYTLLQTFNHIVDYGIQICLSTDIRRGDTEMVAVYVYV